MVPVRVLVIHMKRFSRSAVLAILGCVATQALLSAQTVDEFYKGRTMRMLVGYGAGTGNDIYMRVVARHLGAHLPGKPNIVAENMPGAASLTMMNYLYNIAPRDGSVLGMPSRNLLVEPLFKNDLAKFDPLRFSWLGSTSRDTGLCFTWHTSGIRTLEEATKREVLVGSTGVVSGSNIFPKLLNKLFGTRFRPLVGYPDSGAIGIAMERGELEGYCSFTLAAIKSARPDWLSEKKINILAQLTVTRAPELADAPLIMDFAKDDLTRQALTLAFADQEIGRPVAGPPGLPPDRLKLLRLAFDAMIHDAAFLDDARRSAVDIDGPVNAQIVDNVIKQIYSTPQDVVEIFRDVRDGK